MSKLNDFISNRHEKKYKEKASSEVIKIRSLIEDYSKFSEKERQAEFERIKNSEFNHLTEIRPNIYALATLAIKDLFQLDLYDVQLQGAIALSDKNVIEMKTGEGKTITVSLPALLQACTGLSVHVVTVNEYLAKRDKELLERLYNYFGFSVGLNSSDLTRNQKKKVYEADILYSTANQLGFDYLNDNMVVKIEDKVNLRGLNFALIDEVDLVLIDEARTPLIIGSEVEDKTGNIIKADLAVKKLSPEDYEVDIKSFSTNLTLSGAQKIAEEFGVEDLYSPEAIDIMNKVTQALNAHHLYKEDIDYSITTNNGQKEITIIDTFTGRLQFGRRFVRGTHQAIEAKHFTNGVKIKNETQTVATITLQNFFRLYRQISGMSGTVTEERQEFIDTYGLSVVRIDPNKTLRRIDVPLVAFLNKSEKWDYLLTRILYHHENHDPILIGTVSVEDSEIVSRMLKAKKIKHQVLNAKQDAQEARIISKAGQKDAITIATNMAGRGTDIKVDEPQKLVVILTELNESERIDNQLKGRTSRQGAEGITETIISLQDTIFQKAAIAERLNKFKLNGPMPKAFNNIIKTVQEELENISYSTRKSSLKYDDIIREQRNIFYKTREEILNDTNGDLINKFLTSILTKEEKEKLDTLYEKSSINVTESSRSLLLTAMDNAWVSHIDKLDVLKSGIGWRAMSGHNPLIVYQNEANILYNDFKKDIHKNIIDLISSAETLSEIKTENPYQGIRR